jgi:hypothetical protein
MAGIEDARNIVAQLHQIAPVIDRNNRGNGVIALQRVIVGQEMDGKHGTGDTAVSGRNAFRP